MIDFSEGITDYIEMCSKAKEIQEMWYPAPGDFYIDPEDGEISVICGARHCHFSIGYADLCTWLPRQDQLQKMLNWRLSCRDSIQRCLYEYASHLFEADDKEVWESFWLKIVMFEKFKKVWDNKKKEWVPIVQKYRYFVSKYFGGE